MTLISLKNLDVTIGNKQILKNIDLEVEKGSVTVFIGPSGSGKTTLLRTINLLQKPSQGILRISNTEVDTSKLSKNAIREIRQYSTMIFQSFNLFKNFTVLENVYRPLILNGKYTQQ